MKIAIIGYGRMGKEIEAMSAELGHEVICSIDNESDWIKHATALKHVDVAIEFSMPETAANNILRCFENDIAVVSGTTGWAKDYDRIKQLCLEGRHAFLYASNFSIGMNITFEINRTLAGLMNNQKGYKVQIEETHHTGKKDAPSGTAITLAKDILDQNRDLTTWINSSEIKEGELPILSYREEKVPGTHLIRYDSLIDSIELKHTAHSRKGFAFGALTAAAWLHGKTGVYSMQDLLYDKGSGRREL